jgi:hypothetical protein
MVVRFRTTVVEAGAVRVMQTTVWLAILMARLARAVQQAAAVVA